MDLGIRGLKSFAHAGIAPFLGVAVQGIQQRLVKLRLSTLARIWLTPLPALALTGEAPRPHTHV